MRTRILSATILVLTVLFLTFSPMVFSQDKTDPAGDSIESVRNMRNEAWQALLEKNISMEVSKTTIGNYIKQLRAENEGLNIIVDTSAASYQLPELQFKNISIRAALTLIGQVSDNAISVEIQSNSDGESANMILIRNDSVEQEQPPVVRVINVKQLVGEFSYEELLEAFDEGYELMDSESTKPELRLHEPSGLLFFKGSQAQVALAMEIVRELVSQKQAELIKTQEYLMRQQIDAQNKAKSGAPKGVIE